MSKKKTGSKASTKNNVPYVSNMKKSYLDTVVPNMVSRFSYGNPMEVPKLLSISLNMGIGDAKANSKKLESALEELIAISGQKPIITKSKSDISNFKIRKGYPAGCKVTLRSAKMYEFFERLVCIALPRSRDFRGLSFKSFDGRGNYNFGVKEQIIFAEINYDNIDSVRGLNITITTSANSDDEAYWLLKEMGFPLIEKPSKEKRDEAV
ncbi:MAG: 50S ribosomal protein L5 [bacterium TMED217]|nr:MAG: 50S ribosomal protein L5 [bacterium TMED217]|tara:strand:- start:19595 stop:20221 length:627 start_codon:yes stop_codon:yes gene_type:complete